MPAPCMLERADVQDGQDMDLRSAQSCSAASVLKGVEDAGWRADPSAVSSLDMQMICKSTSQQ